jgi:hypothetical protein
MTKSPDIFKDGRETWDRKHAALNLTEIELALDSLEKHVSRIPNPYPESMERIRAIRERLAVLLPEYKTEAA